MRRALLGPLDLLGRPGHRVQAGLADPSVLRDPVQERGQRVHPEPLALPDLQGHQDRLVRQVQPGLPEEWDRQESRERLGLVGRQDRLDRRDRPDR